MDALTLLKRDHGSVDALFKRLRMLSSRDREASREDTERVLREVTRELSAHAAIEEEVLYPIIANELPDGRRMASEALREHRAMKESLAALTATDASGPRFESRLSALVLDVTHHVQKEEEQVFPKLRGWLGKDRLVELAGALEGAKGFAPTRPHPYSPNKPPVNVIADTANAAIDRVRDVADEGRAMVTGAAKAAIGKVQEVVQNGRKRVERQTTRTVRRATRDVARDLGVESERGRSVASRRRKSTKPKRHAGAGKRRPRNRARSRHAS